MDFEFPEFSEPISIGPALAWTATFDSYDPRNEDVYYRVALHADAGAGSPFFVQIGLGWAEQKWESPSFRARLQEEISTVAATRKTNCDYRGSLANWLSDSGKEP
jgi:hypothetical protein